MTLVFSMVNVVMMVMCETALDIIGGVKVMSLASLLN